MSGGVSVWAPRVALVVTVAAAALALLSFWPGLEAPFLVPKFAAIELAGTLGFLTLVLRRVLSGNDDPADPDGAPDDPPAPPAVEAAAPRWSRAVTAGAWLVLATTALSWLAARGRPEGTPYAIDAVARWLALFGLACGASVLEDEEQQRQRLAVAISLSAAAVAMLGLVQHFDIAPTPWLPIISLPGSTFGNRNLAAEIMAMSLPFGVALFLAERRDVTNLLGGLATLVELVFLLVTRTRGSWLAAACGLATVLWLVLVRQRVPRQVWLIVLGALVAGAVVAAIPAPANTRDVGDTKRYSSILTVLYQGLDVHSSALRTRVGFWRRSVGMLAEHPLLGVGPGNWPVIFPRFAEPGASEEGILSATLVPRQAHDDYVERATETGLLGMAALVGLGVAAARATRKRLATDTPEARVATTGAAGALVALLALAPLSFPLEMPGTIALAGLALGLVVTDRDAAARPWGPALYLPSVAIGAALLVVVPLRAERQARGSKWIEAAEQALHANKGVPGAVAALEALDKARVALPPSYWVELRTAQMLLREKRNDEAIAAAKRVIGIEPYSPNGWGVLAVAYRAAGRPEDSKAAATRGLEIMHDYPLALDARADAEERLGDLAAAEADRARIRDIAEHAGDDATRNTARNLSRPPATSTR